APTPQSGTQAVETAAQVTRAANSTLSIGGLDVGAAELSDPASARLRLSYWRVATRIIRDHFWTGVGLGNFGTVYANYQQLGDGPVQMAHNDYLQILAETGLFGLLAFLALWGYFALWGGRQIIRDQDPLRRGILAGMYAGVLAFLMHAFVDFDFANPSLVAMVVTMAALFYARAGEGPPLRGVAEGRGVSPQSTAPPVDQRRAVSQMIAIPILLAVALVTSAALRVYIFEFTLTEGSLLQRATRVGDRSGLRQRVALGRFLLDEVPKLPPPSAPNASGQPRQIPTRFLQEVALLVPDLGDIKKMGTIRVPIGADRNAHRPLREGEGPPPNAFVAITNPAAAKDVAIKWSEQELNFLEVAYAIFPHDPELTQTLFEWYDLLQMATTDPDMRREYLDGAVKWARAAVEANPRQAWPRQWLGKALMFRGSMEPSASRDYYDEGIKQFRVATDLFPISPMTWSQLGQWQQKLGQALQNAGEPDRAAPLLARGEDALGEAKRLELEDFRRKHPYKWQRMPNQQQLLQELTAKAQAAGR
ncbi:MAG: O-antigen ligase family protein, partial [Candidatus Hydrogenedentales bacterium]